MFLQIIPSDVGANLPWNFAFKRSYWKAGSDKHKQATESRGHEQDGLAVYARQKAVAIKGLHKVFKTTEGSLKAAVDGLTLDVEKGDITALLGTQKLLTPAALRCSLALASAAASIWGVQADCLSCIYANFSHAVPSCLLHGLALSTT